MFLSVIDYIKENFALNLTNTISTLDMFFSLIVVLICSIIINFVYKKTYLGVNYTKSFPLSILLLSLITCLVIRTINSNLSLSLGMVGSLSIIRFRTAVKDSVDIIFMFWAITLGIMCGAGLYLISILTTILIGLIYFISFTYQSKKSKKVLLVIKTYSVNSDLILNIMKKSKKSELKTESHKNGVAELTFELSDRSQAEEILKYKSSPGIISLNILEID